MTSREPKHGARKKAKAAKPVGGQEPGVRWMAIPAVDQADGGFDIGPGTPLPASGRSIARSALSLLCEVMGYGPDRLPPRTMLFQREPRPDLRKLFPWMQEHFFNTERYWRLLWTDVNFFLLETGKPRKSAYSEETAQLLMMLPEPLVEPPNPRWRIDLDRHLAAEGYFPYVYNILMEHPIHAGDDGKDIEWTANCAAADGRCSDLIVGFLWDDVERVKKLRKLLQLTALPPFLMKTGARDWLEKARRGALTQPPVESPAPQPTVETAAAATPEATSPVVRISVARGLSEKVVKELGILQTPGVE